MGDDPKHHADRRDPQPERRARAPIDDASDAQAALAPAAAFARRGAARSCLGTASFGGGAGLVVGGLAPLARASGLPRHVGAPQGPAAAIPPATLKGAV